MQRSVYLYSTQSTSKKLRESLCKKNKKFKTLCASLFNTKHIKKNSENLCAKKSATPLNSNTKIRPNQRSAIRTRSIRVPIPKSATLSVSLFNTKHLKKNSENLCAKNKKCNAPIFQSKNPSQPALRKADPFHPRSNPKKCNAQCISIQHKTHQKKLQESLCKKKCNAPKFQYKNPSRPALRNTNPFHPRSNQKSATLSVSLFNTKHIKKNSKNLCVKKSATPLNSNTKIRPDQPSAIRTRSIRVPTKKVQRSVYLYSTQNTSKKTPRISV